MITKMFSGISFHMFIYLRCILIICCIHFSFAKEYNSLVDKNLYETSLDTPYFIENMSNVTVQVGRTAKFQCVVGNLKNHQVAWFRKDKHLFLALGNEVILKNNRMYVSNHTNKIFYLQISNVREEDKGEYMCQINNSPKIDQSAWLQVTVPPYFVEDLTSSDIDVNEDDSVNLRCAAKGFPSPSIEWRREDKEAIDALLSSSSALSSDNKNVKTIQGEYLNISRVNRHQMGAYLCIASNGIPNSVSKRIFLGVNFSPLVWTPNQRQGAPLDGVTVLLCTVDAYPKPNCYWMKTSTRQIIVHNSKYSIETLSTSHYKYEMRLTIHDIEPTDFTSYSCIAKNIINEAQGEIVLYEIPRPSTQKSLIINSLANSPVKEVVNSKNRKNYLGSLSKNSLNSEDNFKEKLNIASFLTNSYKNDIPSEQITLQTEEKVTSSDDLTDSGALATSVKPTWEMFLVLGSLIFLVLNENNNYR